MATQQAEAVEAEEKTADEDVAAVDAPTPDAVCRLCGESSPDCVHIFGEEGKALGLYEKCSHCLPVLITDSDDLSKSVCRPCCDTLETVRAFFEKCFAANQSQIIHFRKTRGSPLDLETHINQYVRSYLPPVVPHIKIEPSAMCDVDFNYDEDDEGEDDGGDSDYDPESELLARDFKPPKTEASSTSFDGFKVPSGVAAKKRKKRGRPPKGYDPYFDNYDPDWSVPSPRFANNHSDSNGESKRRRRGGGAGSGGGRKRKALISLRTCALCGETAPTHENNLVHWKEKHPEEEVYYKCTRDDCTFQSKAVSDVRGHQQVHKDKPESSSNTSKWRTAEACKICGKAYPRSYLYSRHYLVHSDKKEFDCGLCDKSFKTPLDLKAHMRVHGSDDEKYTHCCELCGKRFTQRANLDAHLRVHSGFKPFACDFCQKTFSQKGNMEEHRRTHTGEKPYVCEICGASFVRRSELQLHNRCVHTGERPYQCAYCPKNFQRRDLLRKHERIHTDTRPYSCQYCQKSFTQRDKMVVHERLHTGERPYVCESCGKGFCESGNLKKHLRVHGKEAPAVVHQNNKGKPAPVQSHSKHALITNAPNATTAAAAAAVQSTVAAAAAAQNSNNAAAAMTAAAAGILPLAMDLQAQFGGGNNAVLPSTGDASNRTVENGQVQQQQQHQPQQPQQQQQQQLRSYTPGALSTTSGRDTPQHGQLIPKEEVQQQQQQQQYYPSNTATMNLQAAAAAAASMRATPIPADDQSDTTSERSVTPLAAAAAAASAPHPTPTPPHMPPVPIPMRHQLGPHYAAMHPLMQQLIDRDWYGTHQQQQQQQANAGHGQN